MGQNYLKSIGLGIAAGAATAAGIIAGQKVMTTAKISQGHPIKHRMLDISSNLLQHKYPLDAMSTYLNGFHFYADDRGRQVEAKHFCIHLRHDLHQCVIFDSNEPDARLIGIEYIISEERFKTLDEDEKQLWRSHHYEVKSGACRASCIVSAKLYGVDMAKAITSMSTWIEATKQLRSDYRTGSKTEKSAILDEFCASTGLGRSTASRYLTSKTIGVNNVVRIDRRKHKPTKYSANSKSS